MFPCVKTKTNPHLLVKFVEEVIVHFLSIWWITLFKRSIMNRPQVVLRVLRAHMQIWRVDSRMLLVTRQMDRRVLRVIQVVRKYCKHSVHPALSSGGEEKGGGGWTSYEIFKKKWGGRCLRGPQLLEGGWWERGCKFLQGGCNFCIKNNLKS